VAIEKRECLDDNGDRGVKPSVGGAERIPLLPRPPHATGPATAPAQSMHRCRQRLPFLVGLRLVVGAIVVERISLWLAIPDCNWTFGRRHQHDFAHRLPDKCCNAAPRPCSHLAQCVELFFPQINLGLLHMCQFNEITDMCQFSHVRRSRSATPYWA